MDWIGLLTGIASIFAALIKIWMDNAPERAKEAANATIQNGRNDVLEGNVAMVNITLDGLLSSVSLPTTGATSDSATGQHSDENIATDIGDLLGAKVVLR